MTDWQGGGADESIRSRTSGGALEESLLHPRAHEHWSRSVSDPMDPALMAARRRTVDVARRLPLSGRVEHLRRLAAGRKVLDIGVVDHDLDGRRASTSWLHGQLVEVAGEILGVDVLEDAVLRLQREGYQVECRDVTAGDLPDGRFDLIVAGEVIEHLSAPGALFGAAAQLLAPDGRFVLSTPNPFALWRIWQHVRGRVHENVDHVLFATPGTLAEYASRAGLRLDCFYGILTPLPGMKAAVAKRAVLRSRGWIVPEVACESIMYEFTVNAS